MNRFVLLGLISLLLFQAEDQLKAQESPAAVSGSVEFLRDVEPLLKEHCWSCHGAEKQESGLRLDRRDLMLNGGDNGHVVALGSSGNSRLIHYVSGRDPDHIMPPEGDRLTEAQIEVLKTWIDEGCAWPKGSSVKSPTNQHWAYQPLLPVPPPHVSDASWSRNPIDHFVLSQLEIRGISPAPEASRSTLIRRLSLDLTGLLPSMAEVDAFVADQSLQAYETLVDRLLASPHFGERWGRHWLDMARYADSDGYEKDNPRPDAYRWRDWVINAINEDMPFDQFTIEQLAGDLLPDATPLQKLATAFHRQTLTNTEGGTDQEQFRIEACFDRTETTGTVWLGLTIGCARCHTHKYDAVTQREYYQLFSFFNNGDETTVTVPGSDEEIANYESKKTAWDAQLVELTEQLTRMQQEQSAAYHEWQEASRMLLSRVEKHPVRLHTVENWVVSSDHSLSFQTQKDGSVLVGGDNPERATYTVTGQTSVPEINALRLDVLADGSLPSNGPGRVAHGNFVLSEVTLEVAASADFHDARKLQFVSGKASFEQADKPWRAADVFDVKNETGWAIAPHFGVNHWLVLGLAEPLKMAEPTFLRIILIQEHGQQHTIGRFLLSLQTGVDPALLYPEGIRQALIQSAEARTREQELQLLDYYSRQKPVTMALVQQLDELKKIQPVTPELAARVIGQSGTDPRQTFVLRRGEFLDPVRELEVQPTGLAILPPMAVRAQSGTGDRLDLARWIVSSENPLTPRVAANHIWRLLFGHGLVRTSNDFGVRGERPTHPELLDWLANEFVSGSGTERPWSRKALIRQIVLSATYRQASRHRPELADSDPQNLLLARQNRMRVEGEIIRDISLDVAGLLSRKIGGPGVFPPIPPGIAELSYAGNFSWTVSPGEDRYRRGMYTFFKRTSPHPNLITFDCPDANVACVERQVSNTPLQALTSLNNDTFTETSRAFARRMLTHALSGDEVLQNTSEDVVRLATAFRFALSRPASPGELAELQDLLSDSRSWYRQHPEQAIALIGGDSVPGTASEENAAWIATLRVLLNLDEFVTRE